MNKLDNLRNKIEQERAKQMQAEAALPDLRKKLAEDQKALEAAALNDDFDLYMKQKAVCDRAEAVVHIAEVKAARHYVPTYEEALAAWKEYAAEHDKKMLAAIAKYNNAMQALAGAIKEALILQERGLKVRKECGEMIGEAPLYIGDNSLDNRFPMVTLNNMTRSEADYFSKIIGIEGDADARARFWNVVNNRNV